MSPAEALAALLDALEEPSSGEAAAALTPLAEALLAEVTARATGLSGSPAALESLVLRSVVAHTDGRLHQAVLARLSEVVLAFVPPRGVALVATKSGPPLTEKTLHAARGAPALRVVMRDAYLGAGRALVAVPALPVVANEGANDAADPGPASDAPSTRMPLAELAPEELPRPKAVLAVSLVDPPPAPVSLAGFHEAVVSDALDAVRGFARDRWEAPASERPYVEGRILKAIDAMAVTGGPLVDRVLAAWSASLALPGSDQSFAAALTLASLSGADALAALLDGIEGLVGEQVEHALAIAEALRIAPHPDRGALLEDLRASNLPAARVVAVRLAGALAQQPVEELRRALLDPARGCVLAALRNATERSAAELEPLTPLLLRWLRVDDPHVAHHAAIALLHAGSRAPIDVLREGEPLGRVLGVGALDLLVFAGEAEDAALFASLAGRLDPSPALYRALGRFGHPGALKRLAHALGDEDLADAAAEALETLFGAIVPPGERLVAGAWLSAVRGLGLDAGTRVRRGAPFSPAVVVGECEEGSLSCRAIASRLFELSIRAGAPVEAAFHPFWPEAEPSLRAALAAGRALDVRFPKGTYHVG